MNTGARRPVHPCVRGRVALRHLLLPGFHVRFLLASLLAFPALASAASVCETESAATLTCSSIVTAKLDPGNWGTDGFPNSSNCPDGFDTLNSDLGSVCDYEDVFGFCTNPSNACSGDKYSCGAPLAGALQDGPDDIYSFVCQQDGVVDIEISGLGCDLDVYVLDDSCDVDTGCLEGSTKSGITDDTLAFDCLAGQTYYIIVEGYGFTRRAFDDAAIGFDVGDAAWCNPEAKTSASDFSDGDYTLSFTPGDPLTSGCVEICDNGKDDEGDLLIDCDDDDCIGDPSCPEECTNNIDDDDDLLIDCDDDDCWDEPQCCDDDQDGFTDDACGGKDCDDRRFDLTDADGDLAPDLCDPCPNLANEKDADLDGDWSCTDCNDLDADLNALDADADGTTSCAGDCADNDAGIEAGALEKADGKDQDCDGTVDEGTIWYDDDGDGFTESGGDCNDAVASVNPGEAETCNSRDDDCDGALDEGQSCFDDDGDGYCEAGCTDGSIAGDCADADAAAHPGAAEIPENDVDDDCDGQADAGLTDADQDGYAEGADCDDAVATSHAGAAELDNGVDDDCDGVIDEGTATFDDDGDGSTEAQGDCHDGDAAIHVGVADIADNGVDDDCDGDVDEGSARTDDDGDGLSEDGGDCDDADAAVNPSANEATNQKDDDCDGAVDENISDLDSDGWTVALGDCDDQDGWANPEQDELCDGVDNNCDGVVDESCSGATPVAVDKGGCGCDSRGTAGSGWLAAMALGLVIRRRHRA